MNVLKTTAIIVVLFLLYCILFSPFEPFFSVRDPYLDKLGKQLSVIHPKLANIRLYVGTKSYTINKKHVYICLKDKNGDYYDRNMLVYVICHEYSHILCDEIGHTPKFFAIFEKVLQRASNLGLFDENKPLLEEYCGHD